MRYFCDYELTRATPGSSGYDIRAQTGLARTIIEAGSRWIFCTGLYLELEQGLEAQVRPRSGLTANHGIVAGFGSVDSDYRGEIRVTLFNHGAHAYTVVPGERIAQIVIAPVMAPYGAIAGRLTCTLVCSIERVGTLAELNKTIRGSSGHGSSGR